MSQREPFDVEEAALAARLRELPQPAPSNELDQRILLAARQAVAPRRARRRVWHWGGAAAAALALLVSAPQWWQTRHELPVLAEPSAYEGDMGKQAASQERARQPADLQETQRGERRARELQDAAPADPTPGPSSGDVVGANQTPSLQAVPSAAPPSARPERKAEAFPAAPPPPEQRAALADDAEPDSTLDTAAEARASVGTGPAEEALMRPAPAPLIKRQAQGAGLAVQVEEELLRIRALRADGQMEAATEALRALIDRHPDLQIPDDLRPLLEEPAR